MAPPARKRISSWGNKDIKKLIGHKYHFRVKPEKYCNTINNNSSGKSGKNKLKPPPVKISKIKTPIPTTKGNIKTPIKLK